MNKIKVIYQGNSKTIAFYPGLDVNELNELLQTVFQIPESVLGFESDDGLVIPIGLACKEPSILPSSVVLVVPRHKPSSSPETPVEKNPQSLFSQPEPSPKTGNSERSSKVIDALKSIKSQKLLLSSEIESLQNFASTDTLLLDAALSVAANTDDSEYLKEVLSDIAQTLQSEEGKQACEAQNEVLQVAYKLRAQEDITDSQLLYLSHLVLIRDDSIADIYETYQQNLNLDEFAQNLYDLVNVTRQESNNSLEKVDETKTFAEVVASVVTSMMTKGKLNQSEILVLLELINNNDKYVKKGFDTYKGEESSPNLEDYLVQCVRTEIESRLDKLSDKKADQAAYTDSLMNENPPNEMGKEKSSWIGKAPDQFVDIVFHAALKGELFTATDATKLCELYQSGYDLIRAAWEVYGVQQDKVDFLDTCRRLVRYINEYVTSDPSPTNIQSQTHRSSHSSSTPKETTEENIIPSEEQLDNEDRKKKALLAVSAAKRELLKHSLEMMVKQKLLTADASINLFKRALQGDLLIDAAIEAYAADRNIAEFLDTLLILATHSEEDIKTMLNYAREDADKESSESTGKNKQSGRMESDSSQTTEPKVGFIPVTPEAKGYIVQIIDQLAQQAIVSKESGIILNKLLEKNDERIYAAFEVYFDTKDLPDFIDSLIRIANYESQHSVPIHRPDSHSQTQTDHNKESGSVSHSNASAAMKTPEKATNVSLSTSQTISSPSKPMNIDGVISSPSKDVRYDEQYDFVNENDDVDNENDGDDDDDDRDYEDEDGDDEKDSNDDDDDHLLGPEDQKNIVNILVSNTSMITPQKQQLLNHLIDSKSSLVQNIFTKYEKDKDAHQLKDSLNQLAESELSASNTPKKSSTNSDDTLFLSALEQKTIVNILGSSSAVNEEQHRHLLKLVDEGNIELRQIFVNYDKDRNIHSLLRSIKHLLHTTMVLPRHENDASRGNSISSDDTVDWGTPSGVGGKSMKSSNQYMANVQEQEEEDDDDDDVDEDNDDDEEDYEDEDDEDEEEEDGDFDDDDRDMIEQNFLRIIQSMNLDRLESSALRVAIARGDSTLKQALEIYRQTHNEELLRQKLKQIAIQTIIASREDTNDVMMEDEDEEDEDIGNIDDLNINDDDENDDDQQYSINEKNLKVEELDEDSKNMKGSRGTSSNQSSYTLDPELYSGISKEDQDFLKSRGWIPKNDEEKGSTNVLESTLYRNLPTNTNEQEDYENLDVDSDLIMKQEPKFTNDSSSDDDDDDDDDNSPELGSKSSSPLRKTSSITSQDARVHIFPILLKELMKESLLSSSDGELLMKEFNKGNDVVNAALDVYDLDSDMGELVDTLQRIARAMTS